MDALSYEYLIRKAYNCRRGEAGGKAKASIYRKMERVDKARKISLSIGSNKELEYNYRSASLQVSMNINEALIKVLNDFQFTGKNKKIKDTLEKLTDNLYMSTDRKIIDNTIKNAHDIFKRIKLRMK